MLAQQREFVVLIKYKDVTTPKCVALTMKLGSYVIEVSKLRLVN